MIGRDYRHAIDRPGAQEWEGKAARAAQDTATGDEKVVYRATQHVLDEGPKALDTLAFQVTEHHKRAVGYYNEATSNGYKVSEEITVEWIVPKGAKPETVAEGKRCAAKLQDMIRGEYDKWWAAEEEAAQQIDAISKELDTFLQPHRWFERQRGASGRRLLAGRNPVGQGRVGPCAGRLHAG
ncbi:MAG: hypothetical protein ACRDDJ_24385 [[Mycobacterium] stephanolepidis]